MDTRGCIASVARFHYVIAYNWLAYVYKMKTQLLLLFYCSKNIYSIYVTVVVYLSCMSIDRVINY